MAILNQIERTISALGNAPPIIADGRGGPPDRREVSARWLSGTFLTGLTSSILMGVALFAALNGRQLLATPPEIAALNELSRDGEEDASAKGARVAAPRVAAGPLDRRRMEVSTVQRVNDSDLVRTVPFVEVNMALAAGHKAPRDYPPFNPLDVFAEDDAGRVHANSTGLIYGAKVESDVTLRTVDFPVNSREFEKSAVLTADDAEAVVRSAGAVLTEGDIQVAALHYVDPQRFGSAADANPFAASFGVRIIQENVTVAKAVNDDDSWLSFSENMIPVHAERTISDVLERNGYDGEDSQAIAYALGRVLQTDSLVAGTILRLGIESYRQDGEEISKIVRASVYRDGEYRNGVALDDHGQLVAADSGPEFDEQIAKSFENEPVPVRSRADLPSAYDAIYRAAYSYGLSSDLTKQLIKLLASDVDYKSRIGPTDSLHVLFSNPGSDDQATEDSEILFVDAVFGNAEHRYYRFQLEDGSVEYFDEEGRSARQFLIRNPVPNGRFRSGYGMRRHPVLGYKRMHTGVDWSAPRGTPIIAAGNGVVEKAGWSGGYGRQTIIRHANGYESSYNHQNAFARGIVPGARVRQGQVIGYIGSTGLVTGPHLHYELVVNGNKVDPMRVRLPTGKVLKDTEFAAFERERKRIDVLLEEGGAEPVTVASR